MHYNGGGVQLGKIMVIYAISNKLYVELFILPFKGFSGFLEFSGDS
jgi:hypothetical protein